jgi:hypothetical protein
MYALLAAILTIALGGNGYWQTPDVEAIGVAFTHARTVIPEGIILVSVDTVPDRDVRRTAGGQLPEPEMIHEAATLAGFAHGFTSDAVVCEAAGACRAIGSFRGLVQVVESRVQDSDSAVVTLRVLRFTPEANPVYEQVDEVHVSRRDRMSDWRIERIIRISES